MQGLTAFLHAPRARGMLGETQKVDRSAPIVAEIEKILKRRNSTTMDPERPIRKRLTGALDRRFRVHEEIELITLGKERICN